MTTRDRSVLEIKIVEARELELKLQERSKAAATDDGFSKHIRKLGSNLDELCHFTALKYSLEHSASSKRADALMRALKLAEKRNPEAVNGWLASVLTTTGPVVGPEEMLNNIANGINGTLVYGMEADYVGKYHQVTTRPLLWLPLGLTALGFTNVIPGSEMHLTYFPALTIASKGDSKTRDYREALSAEDHGNVEDTFVGNVQRVCTSVGIKLQTLTDTLNDNERIKFGDLKKLFINIETSRKEFWEEVPKAVRKLAISSFFQAIRKRLGDSAAYLYMEGVTEQGSEETIVHSSLVEFVHDNNIDTLSLQDLFKLSEERPMIANILGYTIPEALVYMCLPLTHRVALVAAGDKVGNESMRRFRNQEFWKALGRPQGVSPIAYWDEHHPGPGAYQEEPAHYKFFFDRQRPNNSCDIRIGDEPEQITKRFLEIPVNVRKQDLEYFFVPYWIAKGMAAELLGTSNYFEAHRQARHKPIDTMDNRMIETLIQVSKQYKPMME